MKIQKSYIDEKPTLYLIPTPIGNLDDMTIRSINVLNSIDVLFCEDTRVTKKLLNHFNINVKTETYHEHNKQFASIEIIKLLDAGKSVGLVSDAGMPAISDPGYEITKLCDENDKNVVVLPGASAFLVALVRSNYASKQFGYYGFLNKQTTKRERELKMLLKRDFPTVIYESPHQLVKTLNAIKEIDEDTHVFVGREITKKFEEYCSGSVAQVLNHYQTNGVKGECVIIVQPAIKEIVIESPLEEVNKLINEQNYTKKDAIKQVAKQLGVNKNEVYKLTIEGE